MSTDLPLQIPTAPPAEELIAELELRTRELERSRSHFRDVIERNADAIVVVDGEGVVRFANPAAAELFGTPREDLLRTSFGFPLVAGETTELDLLRQGEARVVEMRVVESEWEGEPACIASLRDVTERNRLVAERAARAAAETAARRYRHLARDNARLAREAREADQAKSDLLAVISHDLRTPLNAIMGHAELLAMGIPDPLSAAGQERVERIRLGARHLLYLIDELLSFARLDAGRDELHLREVDARALVREVAAVVEPLAADRSLGFRLAVPDGAVPLFTDPDRLRQVLLNLVGNAVKYTQEGEVRIELHPPDNGGGGAALFHVRDTGVGIRPEHLEKIFEPFWQVDPDQRGGGGGTGLGLSVVRRMVLLLGGQVGVESEPGRGSTFTVRLPPRPAE